MLNNGCEPVHHLLNGELGDLSEFPVETKASMVVEMANDVFGGYNEVYLSLDLDLTKISMGGFDQFGIVIFLKDILNYIKLPMPTVRLSPKTTYVGFYF